MATSGRQIPGRRLSSKRCSKSQRVTLIGLGTNLGDRRQVIAAAIELLSQRGIDVAAISSIVSSSAVGGPSGQPDYFNAVVRVEWNRSPLSLLERLQEIESALGRTRVGRERWGPRAIDLDLLLCGDAIESSPELRLPHPLMVVRPFALVPACEIAPDALHPVARCDLAALHGRLAMSDRWVWVDDRVEAAAGELAELERAIAGVGGTSRWRIAGGPPSRSSGAELGVPQLPRVMLDPRLPPDVHSASIVEHPDFGALPALPMPAKGHIVNEHLAAVICGTDIVVESVER